MSEESLKGGGGEILVLVDVVVGHLVLAGGLVGLVLVLLAGLEVVEQGLEAVGLVAGRTRTDRRGTDGRTNKRTD